MVIVVTWISATTRARRPTAFWPGYCRGSGRCPKGEISRLGERRSALVVARRGANSEVWDQEVVGYGYQMGTEGSVRVAGNRKSPASCPWGKTRGTPPLVLTGRAGYRENWKDGDGRFRFAVDLQPRGYKGSRSESLSSLR